VLRGYAGPRLSPPGDRPSARRAPGEIGGRWAVHL